MGACSTTRMFIHTFSAVCGQVWWLGLLSVRFFQKQPLWKLVHLIHFPVRDLTSMDISQSNLHRRCYIFTTACVWWSKERVESHLACILIHYVHIHTHTVIEQLRVISKERCIGPCTRNVIKIPWENVYSVVFFYEIQYCFCFCDITAHHISPVPAFNIIAMHKCPQIPVELFQNSRHFKGF